MSFNKYNDKTNNRGFTLIELVVVVAIMGLMSTMAMDLYTDNSNQKRYEATKARLAEIKFAIIGDPMMRVGSQAVLSGFFYDMERYPRNINELIIENTDSFCLHTTVLFIDDDKVDELTCEADTEYEWTDYDEWTDDEKNWKGPYLHNIQTSDGSLIFTDAWGNNDGSGNFGWNFDYNDEDEDGDKTGNITITSLGLDRTLDVTEDGTESSGYEVDQTITIYQTEFDYITNLKTLLEDSGYCIEVDETEADSPTVEIDKNYDKEACEAEDDQDTSDSKSYIWAAFK